MKRLTLSFAASLVAFTVSAAESERIKATQLNADRQCERANMMDKSKAQLSINKKCVEARKQLADVAYEEKTAAFNACMAKAKTAGDKSACDNAEIATRKRNEGYEMNAKMGAMVIEATERELATKK